MDCALCRGRAIRSGRETREPADTLRRLFSALAEPGGEAVSQLRKGLTHPFLHRLDGDLEHTGDLGVAHTLLATHRKDLPRFLREGVDRISNCPLQLDADHVLIAAQGLGRFNARCGELTRDDALMADVVERPVARSADQIRAEGLLYLQRLPAPPQFEHHILRNLFRRPALAHDRFSHSDQVRVVCAEDDVECPLISRPDLVLKFPLVGVVRIQVGWRLVQVSVLLMNMSTSDAGSPGIGPDDWDRIARYLTGEADARETEATRRWLSADAERLSMVNALERALSNVSREDTSDVDVGTALGKVKTRFEERKVIPISSRTKRSEARPRFSPYLKAAAILVVLFGGPLLWRSIRGAIGPSVAQTFATTVGERRQFTLADGTSVVLGPTSRLIVNPAEDGRSVTLDGEGYFNVVHDAAHPFTVTVGGISVQDVGTAFAIQSDDSGGVRVAVDSGSVSVGPRETDGAGKSVLNARDRATVNPNGVVLVERSAVSDDDLAWIQGRLVFRDAPLIQVGAELYRWYGVRLRVADSSLASLHLTASFSGEPVDRVLNVIALSLGARIERQGNVATLYRATASGTRH